MLGVRNSSFGFAIAVALGERPSRRQWAGLVLIAGGVLAFGYDELTRT